MPIEDRIPGIFNELDDAVDVGGVATSRLFEHRGRRGHALTTDMLEEFGAVRVVAG